MPTQTKLPVVFLHGVFGNGKYSPFHNKPYWPKRIISSLNSNHIFLDLGALSSDHDRACEAFYELIGGRVDYGEAHAILHGHDRFGYYFQVPLYPQWSVTSPVHLVGHSAGANAAVELYQLLCTDAFGYGTNHRWVRSITSIAGPLSGTTLSHSLGISEEGKVVQYSLAHLIAVFLGVLLKMQHDCDSIRAIIDFRMPQWRQQTKHWKNVLCFDGTIVQSTDFFALSIDPSFRMKRNHVLQDMDKVLLLSIVPCVSFPLQDILYLFLFTCHLSLQIAYIPVLSFMLYLRHCNLANIVLFFCMLCLRRKRYGKAHGSSHSLLYTCC